MRRIVKNNQPAELISWTREKATAADGSTMSWGYDDMPAELRAKVKGNLVKEQGGLCCYTGKRISEKTSHIEHLKPQAMCEHHEDTEYANMLAAFPSSNYGRDCAFGAHKKRNWFDPLLFVHPLRPDCEARLKYRDNGKVEATNPADKGAEETIKRLNLNDEELINWRKEAIHHALFEDQLSKSQIQRLQAALGQPDGNGNYREFCFVIQQACERYLKRFA